MKTARSHDYFYLMDRWRALAAEWDWPMTAFAEDSGQEVFVIESRASAHPALYLSAGIHGDESASVEGLLAWAQRSAARLNRCRFTLFPCLNPWGLLMNTRTDSAGRDLNRCFNDPDCPQTARQIRWLGDRDYDAAVMLHEDYDGTGFYLYEIGGGESRGNELARAAEPFVGLETRAEIDGIGQRNGVVTRELGPDLLEHMPQQPEALFLALRGVPRCYTIETPSEAAIDDRVAAHAAVLDRFLDLSGVAPSGKNSDFPENWAGLKGGPSK